MSPSPVRAAATLMVCLLTACSTPPRLPAQAYVPVSEDLQPLGELELSNTKMRLGALEGEMKLQYVGQMPDTAGNDLAGASVYRVKNSAPYFKKNANKRSYCSEAPLWVAVNSETGAPAWSNEIWLGLLTLEDWSKYSPIAHRSCVSGRYVRTSQ
ncbi:MAG: hypothetical protein ABI885_04535 [Gammaproteobacteria bacterium]